MKKIIIIVLGLLIVIGGIFIFKNKDNSKVKKLDIEEAKVDITKYYTYGTHLNMEGSLKLDDNKFKDIKLTLYNGEFKDYDINYKEDVNTINFNLSDLLNEGIYLEDVARGNYSIFIKVKYEDKETKEETYKYYALSNKTEYKETIYYTLSDVNNKIIINSNNDYETLGMEIIENSDKDIYDVIIDPGHGGMDGGAESLNKKYNEGNFSLELATNLKKALEKCGLKVKLTHEEGMLTKNDLLDEYGTHGRAVISSEVKAKYLLSLHYNSNSSSYVKGLETYSAVNINYDFIKEVVKNITEYTGLSVSTGKKNKVFDGIYSKNFSEEEIENNYTNYDNKGLNRYEITTNSNYYYMIRETGGIITGAYVDDRNESISPNPYYKSNTGCESYILELGYITNSNDLDIIVNKESEFVNAIVDSFKSKILLNTQKKDN